MKALMKEYVIFDGRNIYDPKDLKKAGFKYYGIGQQSRLNGEVIYKKLENSILK